MRILLQAKGAGDELSLCRRHLTTPRAISRYLLSIKSLGEIKEEISMVEMQGRRDD